MDFDRNALKIDAEAVTDSLCEVIRRQIRRDLRREGAVIGMSGGIDSSVVAALCARALGPKRVLGVMMPEKDSSPDNITLAGDLAKQLGIDCRVDDLTDALEALGCYRQRDEAIRRVYPDYDPARHKSKITIASDPLKGDTLPYFHLTVESSGEEPWCQRLRLKDYLEIVAATNLKQRTRMTTLYNHADRLNWAVAGTGNKDEHALGFFVKYGDGGADLKPIAHLYKMQVYQLAEYLGLPEAIIGRTPTTDTYTAEVPQSAFFFGVEFDILDPIWCGMEKGLSAVEVAAALGLQPEQVERVCRDIQRKIRGTEYLRMPPLEISD